MITLIAKEGIDLSIPQSYRPISLPNVDYKILSLILAIRLMKFMQTFISPDQSGFLKWQHITGAICHVINIINFGKSVAPPIITLNVNAEKAFDRVE